MTDTALHELCKGFGALLSRSKQPVFIEEASRLNDRGNLPLHAACSFQASQEVIDVMLKAYPGGASQPNNVGNLPIHQAAMWQAPVDTIELLLSRYPEGATVRNQYGSLPLHMAASNQSSPEAVKLLIDAYPDSLHLQNDDGMTPLDLALADESASETVVALLEGRPPPPELSRRQKADKFIERADALERKLSSMRDAGGRQHGDLREAIQAVRRLADRFPHALYSAGIDPNELEIALSNSLADDGHAGYRGRPNEAEMVILDSVKRRSPVVAVNSKITQGDSFRDGGATPSAASGPRDRVEDLLASIVGLDHVKGQVRGIRRSTEIADLRESLIPNSVPQTRMGAAASLLPPALSDDNGRPRASHMVFVGNPGSGKTAVARLLAKTYHELGILRKPKFLEVERMDLVGRTPQQTVAKSVEVLEEARGGILFIDEAYTLAMSTKRQKAESGVDAIAEMIRSIDAAAEGKEGDSFPLIILAGFPQEMQNFLASQGALRKRFSLTFEFPDYTCNELAKIFIDLCQAKGFYLEDSLSVRVLGDLLERETTAEWRAERNGRVCEMLLSGARTEVRRRARSATFEEHEVDPQLIIKADVENVMKSEFK
jgi:stage V sporulation protein K